jgi:hypothetical protein
MISKYTPIWEALKQHGRIKVKFLPSLHKRLHAAVRKCKYLDHEWHLQAAIECNKANIKFRSEGEYMHMELVSPGKLSDFIFDDTCVHTIEDFV